MIYRPNVIREKLNLKRSVYPLFVLLAVVIGGTYGYMLLGADQNTTFIDGLYMTWITIATIGYSEVIELDASGRVFTMIVGALGIGSLFYILGVFMENLVAVQLLNLRGNKKVKKKIDEMNNHIIVVGLGRVGNLTASELKSKGIDCVVVSNKFEEKEKSILNEHVLAIEGDATEDEILQAAGIKRAKGIIITTANAATTLFVVLSAKELNPKIFVVARADEDSTINKLKRAGADRVVNPYSTGGQRLANFVIKPHVVDFFESSFGYGEYDLTLESIDLPDHCKWFNKSLKELNLRVVAGASVLAVIREGKPILNPGANFVFLKNDKLLAFGTQSQLKKLEDYMTIEEY
jgi:voltage-gated potassium channel